MKAYIYGIKNLVNNKLYIGSTKSLISRKYEHFFQLKKGTHHSSHLQSSYNKYGKDKFAFYVIEECNYEERKQKELFHISRNRTFEREFGYNIYEPNEDNFKCSNDTKLKLSQSSILRGYSIPVDAYKIDGSFIQSFCSVKECSLVLNVSRPAILGILNGTRKSIKGYTFTKKNEPFSYKSSSKQRFKK